MPRKSNKRYKITITEIGQEKKKVGKNWTAHAGEEGENARSDGYGYTPEIEKFVDFEREIYSQSIDKIDLKKVIDAVNK